MAIIEAQVERFGCNAVRVTWPNMKAGDIGENTFESTYQDRSIQVRGTFGSGGQVAMKGSNDGEEFVALTDPRGNDLTYLSPKLEQIEDCTFGLRPEVSGDATTNLTVILFARKG